MAHLAFPPVDGTQVALGALAASVPVLAIVQTWPNHRGDRAALKRDLEILALIPDDSAARGEFREHVDASIRGLVAVTGVISGVRGMRPVLGLPARFLQAAVVSIALWAAGFYLTTTNDDPDEAFGWRFALGIGLHVVSLTVLLVVSQWTKKQRRLEELRKARPAVSEGSPAA